MARTCRRNLLALLSTLALLGALSPAAAAPVTPSHVVQTGSPAVGWSTPATTSHVRQVSVVTGTQASTVLTLLDSNAPTAYPFTLSLPAAAVLVPDGSGGYSAVRVTSAGADLLGHFQAPWARDATGRSLRTWYTVTGTVLTQHVATAGARFPVTADPKYTWGYVTGTVYYKKGETHNIATGSLGVTAICAGIAAWMGPAAGVACLGAGADIVVTANAAYNAHKCVKLKFAFAGVGIAFVGAYTYSGGYCT